MNHRHILWITRTAVLIALLISAQVVTRPLGQLVTGSLVNLILAVSVMAAGLPTGLSVAVISPFFAQLFGVIPPLVQIIPVMAAGNAVYVLVWHFVGKRAFINKYAPSITALVIAAACKFALLFIGVVHIILPIFNDRLAPPQAAAITAAFSVTQLFTALIGGTLAILALPVIKKATGSDKK
ncbi:MAG: hypothetical protein FWE91_02795 [Defluviitaleaceae bacterium]|nr:hypothetical protein [Defluviitaleaceae bacterium]